MNFVSLSPLQLSSNVIYKYFFSLESIVNFLILLGPAITSHLKLYFIILTKQFNLVTDIIALKYLLINLLSRKSHKNI